VTDLANPRVGAPPAWRRHPLSRHAETVEVVKGRYQLVRNETGIPGTFRWTVGRYKDGTEARLEIDHHELPIPFLGRLTAPILRWLNEHEADTLLRNLRRASKRLARVIDSLARKVARLRPIGVLKG
jgi:hypothetical protein